MGISSRSGGGTVTLNIINFSVDDDGEAGLHLHSKNKKTALKKQTKMHPYE